MFERYSYHAKRGGKRYNPLGNIGFYLREERQLDKLFFWSSLLVPIPSVLGDYLGARLPSLLVEGLTMRLPLPDLLWLIAAPGLVLSICEVAKFLLRSVIHEDMSFFGPFLTRQFVLKQADIDYDRIESESFGEVYTNAWNSAYNGRGFSDGAGFLPNMLTSMIAIVGFGWILGRQSLILLALVFVSALLHIVLLRMARGKHRQLFGQISGYARGEAYITNLTMEPTSGKDIRIYRMLDFILKKYDENLAQISRGFGVIHRWYLFSSGAGAVVSLVRDSVVYVFLIRALASGAVDVSEFVFLVGIVGRLGDHLSTMLRSVTDDWITLDASVGYFRQFLEEGSRWTAAGSDAQTAPMRLLRHRGGLSVNSKEEERRP